MLGMYIYDVRKDQEMAHTVFMCFHLYIANIFLLNYLVAILSTIYENMEETGDFKFKCFKYKFIERYEIAFLDTNGYTELVIHPPPFNLPLMCLFPALWDEDKMRRWSHKYSIIQFWVENCVVYIPG
jgi:hypothetical protein